MTKRKDNLQPLNAAEIDTLLQARSAVRRKLLIYPIGFGMTAYLWWSYPILLLQLMLGLLGLLQGLAWVFLFTRYRAFSLDLAEGRKITTEGVVEHQELFDTEGIKLDPSRPVFFLRVNGREVGVSEEDYRQFKTGDPIKLFFAPHSTHILGVGKAGQT